MKISIVDRYTARSFLVGYAILMSAGIGLYILSDLLDNIDECRSNLLEIFAKYLSLDASDELYHAASYVLSQNLVHGDALTMRAYDDQPITFAEWGYLGKGKFQRRDFHLAVLNESAAFSAKGSLFARPADRGKHELFTPTKAYPSMTVSELAAVMLGDGPKEAV